MTTTKYQALWVAVIYLSPIASVECDAQANIRTKLRPDRPLVDPPGANFGADVAVSAGRILVGDNGNDVFGNTSGATFVFDANNGHQLFELHPDNPASGDTFGSAVEADGDVGIVGATRFFRRRFESGSAYTFDLTNGQQIAELVPDDSAIGDLFGQDVGVSGATAVVSTGYFSDLAPRPGSAYLFDLPSASQTFKLTPDDSATGDRFGQSVAIDGSIAVVGAIGADGNQRQSGAAYLFDTTTGAQLAKLAAEDGTSGDQFGWDVAIDDGVAVVGAFRASFLQRPPGAAYVFDIATGEQLHKLELPGGAQDDQFGKSVSISNGIIVVGSPGTDEGGSISGSAHVFDASTGVLLTTLVADDAASFDGLGEDVSIDGLTVAIGAVGDDFDFVPPLAPNATGSVYVFGVVPEPVSLSLTAMVLFIAATLSTRPARFAIPHGATWIAKDHPRPLR